MKKITITEEEFNELTAATAAYRAKLMEEKREDELKLAEIERKMKAKEARKEKARAFFKLLGMFMLLCMICPAMTAMYAYTGLCAVFGGIAWIGIIQLIYAGICALSWLVAIISLIVGKLSDDVC